MADTETQTACGTCEPCESDSEVASVAESSQLGDPEADSDSTAHSQSGQKDKDQDGSPKKTKKKSGKKSQQSGSAAVKKKKKVKKKKDTSFVVDFGGNSSQAASKDYNLQQAFKNYKKTKQKEWKEEMKLKELRLTKRSDPAHMEQLRMKFLEQAKKYFGVPYKRKYWPKDAPEYKSPIFLDCCGLVRRVLYDLKYDFGFKIGPWNQAYMCDTLPLTVKREEDMKPGDLVFISAIYNNTKAKKQRHNMVHVEIWLGDGPKTIGARWQKGKVQVFDNYKFDASSYHSPKYILKSIDTWLKGVCQSYCPIHPWYRKAKMYATSTRSVFAKQDVQAQQTQEPEDADDECLDANDTDDELIMTPDDPEELRRKLRDCMLDGENEDDTPQQQQFGEEVIREETDIDFGASVASAGLGNNRRDGTRSNGAVKLSSSPKQESLLGTSGDSMETAAAAVNFMAKGGMEVHRSKNSADKDSGAAGPIKLKMTTSPALQPVGKAPKPATSKETPSQRRTSRLSQPVQKSAPVGTNRSLPVVTAQGSGVNLTTMKSASASSQRESGAKASSVLPKSQPSSSEKSDNPKPTNSTSTKNLNNSAKVSSKTDQRSTAKTEPVKQITSAVKASKSDSNTKSDSSNVNQKGATNPLVKSAPISKTSPPSQVYKVYTQASAGKPAVQKPGDSNRVIAQGQGRSVQGQSSQSRIDKRSNAPSVKSGQSNPISTPFKPTAPSENASSSRQNSPDPTKRPEWKPAGSTSNLHVTTPRGSPETTPVSTPPRNTSPIARKSPEGTPRPEWKPPGSTGIDEGNRRSSESSTTTTNRRSSESGASKSPTPKSKPQDDTDKKLEKREGIKSPNNAQEKSNSATTDGSPKKLTKRLPPPTVSLSNNQTPMFYIAGGNGVALVENFLNSLGWKRTTDKTCENFRLKWTECKGHINYTIFKDGEQMVNHLPNCNMLTNKLGLMNSLREYERSTTTMKKGRPPRFKMTDIIPETFNLDERGDREMFFDTYKEGEMWICKPTGMNQGKGIFLVRELEDVHKFLREREERFAVAKRSQRPMPRIIQRYIKDPLLMHGRKFDIRAYMLVASTVPFIVLYRDGYIRLSCQKYCKDSTDLTTHLTNQFIQKKDPLYKEVKEDTVISMDQFNTYINDRFKDQKGLEEDWVKKTCRKQMQRIMLHLFNSVRHKLGAKVGFFELYGLDFMVDDNMKVWLIEVNINPALHTNTDILRETVPQVVDEALGISVEIFEKVRKGQAVYPVRAIKNFSYVYCGVDRRSAKQNDTENPRRSGSPTARARSASPIKDEWVPRGRSSLNNSPYLQPLNLPKINARHNKTSDSAPSGHSVRTSATVTSAVTEPVKLKMTHSDGGLTDKAEVKGEPNRGN